jgi:hypothetical protein
MKKIFLLIITPLFFISCNLSSFRESFDKDEGKEALAKAKFDRVLIDSTGEIQVYASMNRASTLTEGAAVQFQDPFKEIYLVVIKENVDEFSSTLKKHPDFYLPYVKDSSSEIAIYGDFTSSRTTKNLDAGKDSILTSKTLNGMAYRLYAIQGNYNKINLFYLKAVFKSDRFYYQVVAWTLLSRRNLYEGIMKKMVESLKEDPVSEKSSQ